MYKVFNNKRVCCIKKIIHIHIVTLKPQLLTLLFAFEGRLLCFVFLIEEKLPKCQFFFFSAVRLEFTGTKFKALNVCIFFVLITYCTLSIGGYVVWVVVSHLKNCYKASEAKKLEVK